MVSSAVVKLGHDPDEVLPSVSGRLIKGFEVDRPEEEKRPVAVEKKEKKAKKDSAWRRFGRDLTELAAKGAEGVKAEG